GVALLLWNGAPGDRYTATVRVRMEKGDSRVEGEAGLLLNFSGTDSYLVYSVKRKKGGLFAQLRIARRKPQTSYVADQAAISEQMDGWLELSAAVDGADVYASLNGKRVLAYGFQGSPPAYNSHGKTWDPDPVRGQIGLIAVDTPAGYSHFYVGPF